LLQLFQEKWHVQDRQFWLLVITYLFTVVLHRKWHINNRLLHFNSIIRKFLHGSFKYDTNLKQLLNSSRYSPLWYRRLAYIPPDKKDGTMSHKCKTLFEPVMKQINNKNKEDLEQISTEPNIQINGMVVGHTPQFAVFGKGITTACANGMIRADIGASTAFDVFSDHIQYDHPHLDISHARKPQVLEIKTDLKTLESSVRILI
jgi:hypothetical protein